MKAITVCPLSNYGGCYECGSKCIVTNVWINHMLNTLYVRLLFDNGGSMITSVDNIYWERRG